MRSPSAVGGQSSSGCYGHTRDVVHERGQMRAESFAHPSVHELPGVVEGFRRPSDRDLAFEDPCPGDAEDAPEIAQLFGSRLERGEIEELTALLDRLGDNERVSCDPPA